MTKKQQAQAHESTLYGAFVVEKYTDKEGNEKTRWNQIGVAFGHGDGKGFNVKLVANPVNGELVVRLQEPRPETASAE